MRAPNLIDVFPACYCNPTGLMPIEIVLSSMTRMLCLAVLLGETENHSDARLVKIHELQDTGPGRPRRDKRIADDQIKRVDGSEARG
jgi:hypothetical protein